ncbi:serine/threonine protein kinase [Microbispora sp. RL4-1S]|uniref:non-specific serine/threonine protein kinase n=2 Tax=Microbispora oryzae TaxID=2806554 RepID=A0A940WJU1_9ACTN|nr:serine/threonine protein kinase [Microbispora oryzae]
MGEVWRATDELLGRDVAVKLLGRHVAADPAFRERFRSEARITAGLTDPGIAQVFDYGESDGVAYLIMELVPGEPLSAILARSGALGPEVTLDLIHQTAKGLYAAHRAGVIHRDVKPGNILVTGDGQVKITDFGIARALEAAPLTRTGLVLGTAQYVSPEQASGRTLTPATDIYSLGVVAYECLAGRPPFTADNHVALAVRHITDPPPPLPDSVPAPVRALVSDILAKDPAERPATGATLLDRIAELRDRTAYPGTTVLGSLTDPEGFAAPRTAGPGNPGGPTGRYTQPPDGPARTSARQPAPSTAPLGPAAGRFPDGAAAPAAPARRRRRPVAVLLAVAVCAVAATAGVLAYNQGGTSTGGKPLPAEVTSTAATPSASAPPSPSKTPRVSRPVDPVTPIEPVRTPSATVSTSASPTGRPTPPPSRTPTPTPPTPTPAPAPSDTTEPTEAPPDTEPPDGGT